MGELKKGAVTPRLERGRWTWRDLSRPPIVPMTATNPRVRCRSARSKRSSRPSPPSKAPASSSSAPSGSARPSEFDPFLLFDDFRNDNPRITSPAFPGTRTAASRPSPTSWPARSSMATAWATGRHRRGDVQWMTAGQRHPPPGDAAGRRAGPDARLPALGQPAGVAQDDGAALPGHSRVGAFPRSPTTTAPACGWSAASSGASAGRWKASPPIRATSTCRCRRDSASAWRWRPRATRSPTSSPARARSVTPRSRGRC